MNIGDKVKIQGKYPGEIFKKVDKLNYGYDFIVIADCGKFPVVWCSNKEDLTLIK